MPHPAVKVENGKESEEHFFDPPVKSYYLFVKLYLVKIGVVVIVGMLENLILMKMTIRNY